MKMINFISLWHINIIYEILFNILIIFSIFKTLTGLKAEIQFLDLNYKENSFKDNIEDGDGGGGYIHAYNLV